MKIDIINKQIILDRNVTIQELIYQLESSVIDYKEYTLIVERVSIPYQSPVYRTPIEWIGPGRDGNSSNPYDIKCRTTTGVVTTSIGECSDLVHRTYNPNTTTIGYPKNTNITKTI